MLTIARVPLNERAEPNFPAADQVAPEIVPLLPVPEASAAVVPEPASKAYAATRPAAARSFRCSSASTVARLVIPLQLCRYLIRERIIQPSLVYEFGRFARTHGLDSVRIARQNPTR